MNSKRLKELHPEVYKKFFTENELVLSMPLSMDWTLSSFLSGDYQGVHLRQKIPLRTYIGISKCNQGSGVVFDKTVFYDIESDMFLEEKIRGADSDGHGFFAKLADFLNSECNILPNALSISILVETSVKMDLGVGVVMCLLAFFAALGYKNNDFLGELLSSSKSSINFTYYHGTIGEYFKKALLFYKSLCGSFPYLSMTTGLFSGAYPFVGYRAPVVSQNPEDRMGFFGLRNSDISIATEKDGLSLADQSFAFDLALVYSGIPIVPNKHSFTSTYSKRITLIKEIIHQKLIAPELLNTNETAGFEPFFSNDVENMDKIFTKTIETINLEIWHILLELSTNRSHIDALERLCVIVNKVLPLFKVLDYYSRPYISVVEHMNRFLGNTTVGVFPFDITSGGGVVSIISPLESNRKKVHQMVEEYRKMHPDSQMSIIYESRKDGYEYEGVKVEQDIRSGIFSDFIERGNCMIQHYDGSTQLIEHSQIALQTYDDIIVDTIHHKIYIPGHKLTSKDLHTQTSTSEILEIALQHLDTDIPNTKLPVGAYAKNKNDMTAKVIIPLKKLIEKYCNKDLMFTCSGSLTSFSIRLSPGKVKFGIVKPLP